MHVQMPTRRFTVEEFQRMAEAGILGENDRVELLDGRIVEMTPIGERHAACVRRLNNLLAERAGGRAIVDVQDPVYLDPWSLPQPDVTLLRPRADFYTAHPRPEDILLVIEVADTSLRYDRDVKLPRYAAGGIPEAWLIDLDGERIEVYSEPGPEGYARAQIVARDAELEVAGLPGVTLRADEILGH
jgi:Uma2 family endonuclease